MRSPNQAVLWEIWRVTRTEIIVRLSLCVVGALIAEKKKRGTAIVAIAHDEDVRDAIADEIIDVGRFAAK